MAKTTGTRRLMSAIYECDLASVRAALDAGASPTAADGDGSRPLDSAAMAGMSFRFSAVAADESPQYLDIIRLLVERGAPLDEWNSRGMTALHTAAITGRADVLQLLLELGADVHRPRVGEDDELLGGTALHHLCRAPVRTRLADGIRVLLAAGANADARTASGQTPLMLLCASMTSDALSALPLLFDAGADPNAIDMRGYTALMTFVEEGVPPFAQELERATRTLLLARGARAEALVSLDLVRAAGDGNLAGVKAALAAGAEPDFRPRRFSRAIVEAAGKGNIEIVRELLRRGANPNGRGSGDLPLVAAAQGEHLMSMRALVDAGADPNGGEAWQLPLDVTRPDSPAAKYLESLGAVRSTWATERGCPNLDHSLRTIVVRANADAVLAGLERIVQPERIEHTTKLRSAAASLVVYQLTGHAWTAVQVAKGKRSAARLDRDLAVALSKDLGTEVVHYENSDTAGYFAWELFSSGDAIERFADEEDYFSRDGRPAPDPANTEAFLDARARELDLLVPHWSADDLARERKGTFAAVAFVVMA